MSEAGSPYAPPESAPPPSTAPGLRLALSWLLQRALVLVVLPVLLGLLVGVWGLQADGPPAWMPFAIAAATALAWTPTTAVQLWTAFLAPRTDPRGVVLAGGNRFDRSQYRWWVRAQVVERAMSAVLLVLMAGVLANVAAWLLPLSLAVVAMGAWVIFQALTGARLAEATIAHFGHQPELAAEIAQSIVARPLVMPVTRDAARVVLAHGLLRLGDVDGSLEALAAVKNRKPNAADLLEAQIRIGRGDIDASRAVLRRWIGRPAVRLGYESLAALIDLHAGNARAVIERARGWDDLRRALPDDTAAGLAVWEAAAHAMLGDRDAARAVLSRYRVDLPEREWMRAVWPRVWELVAPLS